MGRSRSPGRTADDPKAAPVSSGVRSKKKRNVRAKKLRLRGGDRPAHHRRRRAGRLAGAGTAPGGAPSPNAGSRARRRRSTEAQGRGRRHCSTASPRSDFVEGSSIPSPHYRAGDGILDDDRDEFSIALATQTPVDSPSRASPAATPTSRACRGLAGQGAGDASLAGALARRPGCTNWPPVGMALGIEGTEGSRGGLRSEVVRRAAARRGAAIGVQARRPFDRRLRLRGGDPVEDDLVHRLARLAGQRLADDVPVDHLVAHP